MHGTTRDRVAAEIPRLRRFARGLTRNPAMADDLVQDCVERALARLDLYDQCRSLTTWLLTILRNVYLNRLRGERVERGHAEHIATLPPVSNPAGPQFEQILAQQVLAAVHDLPADLRETLLLVAVEGLSYREAGIMMEVPIGTVMSRLARAREQLRGVIDADARPQLRRIK